MVRAGERGFDSSFSHPPVARTVELGLTFRVGYISVPPASPGKNITIQECLDTINAGQKLNLVFEMSATRATLGAAYGALDGAAAKQEALRRGQPTDVPIILADDTSTTVANLPKKADYFAAAAETAKPFDIGIYGGVKILRATAGLWKIGWVPITAWSWSVSLAKLPNETSEAYNKRGRAAATQAAIDVGAHCLQDTGFYIDNTWAIDPNTAIADFPAWGLDVGPPTQGDDDMAIVLTNSDADSALGAQRVSKWRLMDDGRKRHIPTLAELKALGDVPGVDMTDAELNAIPDWTPPTTSAVGGPLHIEATLTGTAVPGGG